MLVDHWPLFGLRIETPSLTLVHAADDHLSDIVTTLGKVQAVPGFDWFWQGPEGVSDDLAVRAVQSFWRYREAWRRDNWYVPFVVLDDGEVRGVQSMYAKDFPILRSFETESWVDPDHQGRGIGKEMRSAVLSFGFSYLQAEEAVSTALHTSIKSNAVSRALGYSLNGTQRVVRSGKAAIEQRYLLPVGSWRDRPSLEVDVHGFDACRAFFFEADRDPAKESAVVGES